MASIIRFQVIKGALSEEPLCYILQLDEYKILLDCGWNESFSQGIIDEYKKNIKEIDAVLLSFPDLEHIGALPYLVAKCGLNCPIYATIPVVQMGQMFMYDLLLSQLRTKEFDLFALNDIDLAFDKIKQLSYKQKVNLEERGLGLSITPLQAGHMIGGTLWKISKEGEEEIVYAVDYNHQRERHLNSATFDLINKPTLLITDAFNISHQSKRRNDKNEKTFTDSILKCLRGSGNVLVCTDTAGRVLELAHLVDQLWKETGLMAYSAGLLNNVSTSVIDFAKSQVEWMNEKIHKSFSEDRYNPFTFKCLKLCDSLEDINKLSSPKLVLCSTPDMECGFSRELFTEWCSDEKNLVIFTKRPTVNTLSKLVIENQGGTIPVELRKKVKLEGKELENYYKMLHEKAEKEMRQKKSEELESIDIDSSSSEEEVEKLLNIPENKYDKKRNKVGSKRKNYPIFPFKENLIKWDDYGQIIKAEDYIEEPFITGETSSIIKAEEINHEFDNMENIMETEVRIEATIEVPTKYVSEKRNLDIKAKILQIDFEGRSDGESIKTIISTIKPKNLIIIHGNERSTHELADYCKRKQIVQERIFTPREGDIIDATSELQMYQVKLKDSIVSALKFHKSKDYELSWVEGVIKAKNLQLDKAIIPSSNAPTSLELEYSLHALDKECKLNKHKAVFVNELKLYDLKPTLLKKGIQAEFHQGVLVCNNVVAIRKEGGKITLEGFISDDYFKIRSILYEEFAIL